MRLRKRKSEEAVFTGNCMVRQTTFDGASIGRCYHSTYNGICHVHGDVGRWLSDQPVINGEAELEWLRKWPYDYEMETL